MNLFIEGMQGTGKSTLATKLQQKLPDYKVYHEGDYSPVELAWCSYMEEDSYEEILKKYPSLAETIQKNTYIEADKKIVTYTRIMAESRAFYEEMEKYEIYNGNVDYDTFCSVIYSRYEACKEQQGIFECSVLQNAIECMMLYYEMEDEQIIAFYKDLYKHMKPQEFCILYLESDHIRENVLQIKAERVDDQGNEMWFPLMMAYLKASPYGKHHNYEDVEDMIAHFQRRRTLERRILEEVFAAHVQILESKQYDIDVVFGKLKSK